MSNPLDYRSGENLLPENWQFGVSPSKFNSFIGEIHNWYRTEVLKETLFTHSTSSVIGTIIHYISEVVALGKEVDKVAINEYIDSYEVTEDYDPNLVREHYPAMAERLVNDYVLQNNFLEVEGFHYAEIRDDCYAKGSIDRLEGTKEDCCIVDYKSYHSKTKPKAIPRNYKYQLLVYAWILKQKGYNPTRIKLVYINRHIDGGISEKTGKPLKSYLPEVTELVECITDEDIEFIGSLLNLCIDTVEAGMNHPELLHVIYHDMRLKGE